MNEPIHFATGYLLARLFKKKHDGFEALFMSMSAFIPDFDYIIRFFNPSFSHGVVSHTFLGGLFFYSLFFLFSLPIILRLYKDDKKGLLIIYLLGVLAMISHLFLDSFTFYESIADASHHLYFWPLWDFPVHINTIFPSATYEIRVWIEIIYSIIVGIIILIYWCLIKKECFIGMFNPKNWIKEDEGNKNSKLSNFSIKTRVLYKVYSIIIILIIILELILSN